MPSKDEILKKVIEVVCDQLTEDPASIKMETSLTNDLNADSLDIVDIIMSLEEEYDLSIPDEEAEKLKTVGDAVEYIHKHLQQAAGKS